MTEPDEKKAEDGHQDATEHRGKGFEGSEFDTAALNPDELADDEDDEDDEETVIAVRRRPGDVSGGTEEWRERASQAAEALGEPPQGENEWGEEFGDPSLARSVAAASGELPSTGEDETTEIAGSILSRARVAQQEWAQFNLENRCKPFDTLRKELVRERADHVSSLATAIGRPMVETLIGEFIPTLEALRTLPEVFGPLLTDRFAPRTPLATPDLTSATRMTPWGVVAISHPLTAPFAWPFILAVDAVVAGNAVIICSPDRQPRVAETMRRLFHVARLPEHLVQVVSGEAAELLAILEAGPDKVIYFGDPDHEARLAASCAAAGAAFQSVRPGKSTMLVLSGAQIDRAVHAAMWGAFAGGGMLPGSLERVIVQRDVYDEFRMRLIEATRAMNSHHAQLATIRDTLVPERFRLLLDDAVVHGARVTWPAGEEPGRWIVWKAAVVEGLADDALLSTERIEGPGVVLYKADDPVQEAQRLHQLAPAGALSVVGRPAREQRARLEALPVARLSFQDVSAVADIGWAFGPDLPRTLCGPLAMLKPRVISEGDSLVGRIGWFPYTDDKAYALLDAIEASYGVGFATRLKARLKLLLNGPRRRLLKGDNS